MENPDLSSAMKNLHEMYTGAIAAGFPPDVALDLVVKIFNGMASINQKS